MVALMGIDQFGIEEELHAADTYWVSVDLRSPKFRPPADHYAKVCLRIVCKFISIMAACKEAACPKLVPLVL